MQLIDGTPVYSATDLVGFLACEHLTNLERAGIAGLVTRPVRTDPQLDLVRKRGFEHERRFLDGLAADGRTVTRIEPDTSDDAPDGARISRGDRLRRQVAETETAIRRGDDVIYQAAFFDGTWLGYADFLTRVPIISSLGDFSYEIVDTKLAHEVRASALIQLCTYAVLLERVQGIQPAFVDVALGGSERRVERHRLADYAAFYRRLRARFEARVVDGVATYPPAATYPEPVDHCAICRWWAICSDRRRADDHLSLVAGITRNQRRVLPEHGAPTRRTLARLELPPPRMAGTSRESVTRVREQARLQVAGDDAHQIQFELVEPDRDDDNRPLAGYGLGGIPVPSGGDLFLDFEGDPFALDDGLEYLVGIAEPGPGLVSAQPTLGLLPPDPALLPTYHAKWAFDRAGEKAAFEWLIDFIVACRWRDPALHVYHYGSYERGRVARLSTRHATREDEVDRLLRDGVFVDLYRAVRQGIRASVESYSIKRLEPLYGFHRDIELREADKSIVEFERYLEEGGRDQNILDAIAAYNRDDCISTWRLRDWLEDRRPEAERQFGALPRPGSGVVQGAAPSEERQRVQAVADRLADGVPANEEDRTAADRARILLGNLLDWHWREEKSTYWRFHELIRMEDEELAEQREPIVGLEFRGQIGETPGARGSSILAFDFAPQDNDVQTDDELYDPRTFDATSWNRAGSVQAIDQVAGRLEIKRPKRSEAPYPTAVVPLRRFRTDGHRAALLEVGAAVIEDGIQSDGPFRAARDLLLRATPRVGQPGAGRLPDDELDGVDADLLLPGEDAQSAAVRLVSAVDGTTLAIQGPPGSGKTTTGAQMIVRLLARGAKVGITALSHKVIGNLLDEVCAAGAAQGIPVRAVQRAGETQGVPSESVILAGSNEDVRAALDSGAAQLAAGTSWLWVSAPMRDAVDTLFVDEAGQMSLANAVAVTPSTRNLVLLGDPQQLEQPTHGAHPPGAGASALEHVLGGRPTIPPHQGLFLEHTWRLHPAICAFTSEVFYEGRLESRPGLERQTITGDGALAGDGLRWLPVLHVGNRNESPEEVTAVRRLVGDLLDGSHAFAKSDGSSTLLTANDILIVAPYNAQVAAIKRAMPSARVGTVDKFQGQQAPIVIYTMTTSSPEEAPRGLEFLYSLNRLNVATSRAKALVIVACSPSLLEPEVHSPRQLRLANALARYLELALQVALPEIALGVDPVSWTGSVRPPRRPDLNDSAPRTARD